MKMNPIMTASRKLLEQGEMITYEEAASLSACGDEYLFDLLHLARKVTDKYMKNGVYLCSIISAKTGACSEDCSFCSQSVHSTPLIPSQPMIEPEKILDSAKRAENDGASEFCIVTSGRGPDRSMFNKVIEAVRLIRENTNLSIGCSLGLLTEEQAKELSEAGVNRYNHNLETSRSYFPHICSTHTYDDRIKTARMVKHVGMELCCGGIIGAGESPEQRLELAFELREINPTVVPINFLNPRPNTTLAKTTLTTSFEALKYIALFRLILPRTIIICAGGREVTLKNFQPLAILSGANALITGDYLTTQGRSIDEDKGMLDDLGIPTIHHLQEERVRDDF